MPGTTRHDRLRRALLAFAAATALASLTGIASAVDVVIDEPPPTAGVTCAQEEDLENRTGTEAVDLPPCLWVRSTADKATISPDPTVELATDQSAVPGDGVDHEVTIGNQELSLDLVGEIAIVNYYSQEQTIASYHAYVEYRAPNALGWDRLAVTEAKAAGYAPLKPTPAGPEMTAFDPDPQAASPTTYPASGDRIVGTRLPPGSIGFWEYDASLALTPAQVAILRDPERAEKVRFVFRAEATHPPTPVGHREVEGRTSVVYMAKQLRPQTGELRDGVVELDTVSGDTRILDASAEPGLANLAPGESTSVSAIDSFEAPAERSADESEADYLARLEAAEASPVEATAAFKADADGATNAVPHGDDILGIDTDPTDNDVDVDAESGDVVIWEDEYEVSQDPERQPSFGPAESSTERRLPIISLTKSGADQVAAGATAVYELDVENSGSAAAQITELSDRLTEPQGRRRPVADAPATLAPGQTATAHASHLADESRRTIADEARLRWVDANDNPYGPLTDSFSSDVVRSSPDAPPLDPTIATNLYDATAFLYGDPDPLQTGVVAGTIDPERAAVVRGLVTDRLGSPLEGVSVSVVDHPEYGSTETQADGGFYLALNGGSTARLRYAKAGYLSAERTLDVQPQDYTWADDVVLTEPDTAVSEIDLSAPTPPAQVARASSVTDADGSRQATLIFDEGTTSEMELPDGSTEPLDTLSVRQTEYTVGPSGEEAMPADLPPTSGYTYAVELSVDEAEAAGAEAVTFSEPVASYTENFVGWPVGEAVPVGYYDGERGAWIPVPDGRVVEVLSEAGGVAELDVDGSGQPAGAQALADLGVSVEEREELSDLYDPGQELWRVAVEHFTPYDFNGPVWIPADAEYPSGAKPPDLPDEGCESAGSVIECESQVLGEDLRVTGSELGLHYRSDRVAGRKRILRIPLTDSTLPPGLLEVGLRITVAGRRFAETFPAQPNQTYTFEWDGRDAFGRSVQGRQRAVVRIGYRYDGATYANPAAGGRSFAQAGTAPMTSAYRGDAILWTEYVRRIGAFDVRPLGLGGWTLSAHHAYDPQSGSLYYGDGRRRTVQPLTTQVVAGGGDDLLESGPATEVRLRSPEGMDWGADGSLYFAEFYTDRIRRVSPDGQLETVAGTDPGGYGGDGGPATLARLDAPTDVKVAGDGTLFIADYLNGRVRQVAPDGTITTVAGGGSTYPIPDGIEATDAYLRYPTHLDLGADGSLYIADRGRADIYRVDVEGKIHTVPGVSVGNLRGMGVAEDGTIYYSDADASCVRRVTAQGQDGVFAGCNGQGYAGDGGPATQAKLDFPRDIEVASDGSVYIVDAGISDRIRRVDPDGTISTVVGGGANNNGAFIPGLPATELDLRSPNNVAFGPDGTLHVSSWGENRVLRFASDLPGFDGAGLRVASEDGAEVYEFSSQGRHLRTLDAFTGATVYEFFYDAAGRLDAIEDGDGNLTEIERDASGNPTAVVAPYGQRTELSLDADGYLDSSLNPASDEFTMTSTADGLLEGLTDPRGNTSSFDYDADGRLVRDDDRAGGSKTLTRSDEDDGYSVALETKMGRERLHEVTQLNDGSVRRSVTDPAGLERTLKTTDDQGSSTLTLPDGTEVKRSQRGDPRFGMQAPYASKTTLTTPAGKQLVIERARTATLSDPADALSHSSLTESQKLNGRTYTTAFSASTDTFSTTTPAGRIAQVEIDGQGRPLAEALPGIEAAGYSYDERGRLAAAVQGSREWSFTHDAEGNLDTATDPIDRTQSFDYDDAGRLESQTLPDGREIAYSYDRNGNLTSITPPGRPAHSFTHNAIDDPADYSPPGLGDGAVPTSFTYNGDHQPTAITRPDGTEIALGYDVAGRLDTVTEPGGAVTDLNYGAQSGRLDQIASPGSVTLDLGFDGPLPTSQALSGPIAGSVTHAYDNDLRITETKVNNSSPVTYGYDADSLLTAAGALTLGRSAQTGQLTSTTLSGVTSARSYNAYGELASEGFSRSGDSLYSASYVRDDAGRVTEKTETTAAGTDTWSYSYDEAGRLTDVDRDGADYASYAYDQNGNRTAVTDPQGTTAGTFDAQDRIESWDEASYEHTKNGELDTKTEGGDVTDYDYDALGNLDRAELPSGTEITYLTDGLGRRIGRKEDGQLTEGFLYGSDAVGPAAELDPQGSLRARFVYATSPYVPDYMVRSGTTYRIVRDQLGSPRLVVDTATGNVAQEIEYDPFGEVISDSNPGFQPFGFAGGLYDPETGLVRFGARDYDPEVGRFTTKDPIGFAGGQANLYGYVLNDPVNLTDPSGLDVCALGFIDCGDDDPCGNVLTFLSPMAGALCAVPPPYEQPLVNASAGVGDGLTSVPLTRISAGRLLREDLLSICNVDPESSEYQGAHEVSSTVRDLYTGAALANRVYRVARALDLANPRFLEKFVVIRDLVR